MARFLLLLIYAASLACGDRDGESSRSDAGPRLFDSGETAVDSETPRLDAHASPDAARDAGPARVDAGPGERCGWAAPVAVGTLPPAVAPVSAIYSHDDYVLMAHRTGDVIDAVRPDGTHIGVLTLEGASTVDVRGLGLWTNRAAQRFLLVADVGDEGANRAHVVINRVEAPAFTVTPGSTLPLMRTETAEQAQITFADGPHDVRAVRINSPDYDTLDVTLYTYESGQARVYLANISAWPGSATATLLRTVAMASDVTGYDGASVLRNASTAFAWPEGTAIDDATAPCTFALDPRGNGAIGRSFAYGTAGGLYAVSGAASGAILFYAPR